MLTALMLVSMGGWISRRRGVSHIIGRIVGWLLVSTIVVVFFGLFGSQLAQQFTDFVDRVARIAFVAQPALAADQNRTTNIPNPTQKDVASTLCRTSGALPFVVGGPRRRRRDALACERQVERSRFL